MVLEEHPAGRQGSGSGVLFYVSQYSSYQLLNAHLTCSAESHCALIRQLALCWRWPLPCALIATGALQKAPEPWGKTGQQRAAEDVP